MLWLSRKDIEHISRRLLRDYLKKVPQKVDHIDPADFAEKMCGLQFTFADISEAHDAIGLTATSGVIITIPQRDGTRLDYELDGKTAFIDQSLVAENQIGRLNFTMMHEAAHQLFWMLYTLADGASVRSSAPRPPVRSIFASKDGQVRCRAIPTQAKTALAICPRHDPVSP